MFIDTCYAEVCNSSYVDATWVIYGNCSNEVLTFNSTVKVPEGKKLILKDSVIWLNVSEEEEPGFINDGELALLSSTIINPYPYNSKWKFTSSGMSLINSSMLYSLDAYLSNSKIINTTFVGKSGKEPNSMVIMENNIAFINNTLLNFSLFINGANNIIKGNKIQAKQADFSVAGNNNSLIANEVNSSIITLALNKSYVFDNTFQEASVYIESSSTEFKNNKLINSDAAIVASKINISNSVFDGNGHNITLAFISTSATIRNTTITDGRPFDLYSLSSSLKEDNVKYESYLKAWLVSIEVINAKGEHVPNAKITIKDSRNVSVAVGETGDGAKKGIFDVVLNETFKNKTHQLSQNPYTIIATKNNIANTTVCNITRDTNIILMLAINETNETNITVYKGPVIVEIKRPENKTYLKRDLINGTYILIEAYSNFNMSKCNYSIISEKKVIKMSSKASEKMFESRIDVNYYPLQGQIKLLLTCTFENGMENTTSVMFTVYPGYECLTNDDCEYDEFCNANLCENVSCECGYIEDHECKVYECCSNDACEDNEYCDLEDHECKEVTCPDNCGIITNHECIKPEGYCCWDHECGERQICDTEKHKCVTQYLHIEIPKKELLKGDEIEIIVRDQYNNTVAGVDITITFASGNTINAVTDENGMARVKLLESGPFAVSVRKKRYTPAYIQRNVKEPFNIAIVIISLVIIIATPTALYLYYYRKKDILKLEKHVGGRNVLLVIKNLSKDTLRNLIVTDSVPKGSFYGCNVNPLITDRGSFDELTWEILELPPGEEVVIEYEASSTSDSFSVKYGDKIYVSTKKF
ncbi:MAG TPA: hypothetical protein ENG42_00625 [Candidatus Aenigmarchaeota archaeon]|nr:hypothetical protein [Candidatus Aenigmarchaeota archaeon]